MKVEVLLAIILLILFLIVGAYWAFTPLVLFSQSTGECVRVIPKSAGTCDNLPARYEKEIVW